MKTRLELQELLEDILGSRNVYYQPPETLKIKFPAIVYEMSNFKDKYADDDIFFRKIYYTVTYISASIDMEIIDKLSRIKYCKMSRQFTNDNLYHTVYDLYF